MMPILKGVLLAVSGSLAASIVAKGTVVVALAFAGVRWARHGRAAVRHALLAAVFAVLALLPIASIVVPAVRIAVPTVAQNETATPSFEAAINLAPPAVAADAAVGGAPAIPRSSGFPTSALLLAAWAIGAALCLLPMATGLWQVRSLRRSGLPWRRGRAVVESLALEAGLHRRVAVLLLGALPGPATCGVVHPAIMLPLDARTWKKEDLDRVVVHELEHVRRGDWASHCLARAVCAVYWFHPLVWIAWRRLALEAERSCDDAVLRRAEATAYADQLVGFAQRLAATAQSPLLAMASPTDLATRVRAVLDSRQRRGRVGGMAAVLACATAMLLALAVSPLRVVARAEIADAAGAQQQSKLSFDVAVVREWQPGQMPQGRYRNGVRREPGRVWAEFAPFSALLRYAFNLTGSEKVEGLPGWAGRVGANFGSAVKFFIDARMPASTTDAQARLMMQSLLEDRFKLASHWTTKPTKVLELVVAPGGLKLKPPNPAKDPKLPDGTIFTCPSSASTCAIFTPGPKTMGELAGFLSTATPFLGRPVVDKTGLSGAFFFPELILISPDSASVQVPSAPEELRDVAGLKLRPATDTVPVLVIDQVEKLQGIVADAQSASAPPPAFDTASVKPVEHASGQISDEDSDPVHLAMIGTMHRFIVRAYGITDGQLGAEPDWFKTQLFSIDAVTAAPTSLDQKMLMLRGLLADRFQLKLRQEGRDLPIYALEIAAGGPKFQALKPGEHPSHQAKFPGTFEGSFASVTGLVNVLNNVFGGRLKVDRPVVDRTHLAGEYNMQLQTEVEIQTDPAGRRTVQFPSLFHDLQSELGLKLVPDHATMPYFVVEQAAKPTLN